VIVLPVFGVTAQDDAFDCGTDEDVVITYYGDPAGSHPDAEKAAIAAFEELCPNINVLRIDGSSNTTEVLATYLQQFEAQSGDVDVIRVDVIFPGQLAEHLLDLSEYVPQEQIDQYLPALIQNDTVDGRLVALPLRIGFGMLYYRTDLIEKYGYDGPPATWAELEEMAMTIQEGERAEGNDEFWGYVWQGNSYEGLTCNALEWQVSEGAGNFISPEGEIQVTNDAAITALERAAGWVGTISPPGVVGYQEEDARGIWHVGNAAFMRNWPYAYSTSLDSEAIAEASTWRRCLQANAARATLGGWHMGVSRYSENQPAAAAFVRYFTALRRPAYYSSRQARLRQ
jgi:trehalose/maltose transport system substrate-binding protein